MRTLGWLRRNVISWIDDSSASYEIDLAINQSIDVITNECPFSQLTKQVNVTPTVDGIIYAPPRSIDIIDVYPASDKTNAANFVFKGSRRVQGQTRRTGYYLRNVGIVEEPLAVVRGSFVNGSNGVTDSISSDGIFHTLNHSVLTSVNYGVISIRDQDNSIINSYGIGTNDLAIIIINLTAAFSEEGGLQPSEEFYGRLVPEVGSAGIFMVSAPNAFDHRVVEL